MSNLKVCPLAAANPQQNSSDCLGEACACYVKMHKRRVFQNQGCQFYDSEFYYRYAGCGLVAQIPWQIVKIEKVPKASNQSS
jgi:hypothetical protein